jgi:hypothetical protein
MKATEIRDTNDEIRHPEERGGRKTEDRRQIDQGLLDFTDSFPTPHGYPLDLEVAACHEKKSSGRSFRVMDRQVAVHAGKDRINRLMWDMQHPHRDTLSSLIYLPSVTMCHLEPSPI